MRWFGLACAVVAMAGCGKSDTDTPVDDPSGCGAVTEHTLTLRAKVVDSADQPVSGALVRLEERNWDPQIVSEVPTDASGEATLASMSLTSVERCWGTALDYVLVASLDARSTEVGVNASLFNAIESGGSEVDRRDRPLVLPD